MADYPLMKYWQAPDGTVYEVCDEEARRVAAEGGNSSGGGISFEVDETLSLENGILSVNRATEVEQDNTLPITSAAVHTTVGNIELLLSRI